MLKSVTRLPPTRSSCLAATTSANGAVRRPQIFQLQYKHLTTLCYASIIATAAAADVRSKQRRRARLDTAIADARRSLYTDANEQDGEEEHVHWEQEDQLGQEVDEEAYETVDPGDASFQRPSVLERLDDQNIADDLHKEIKQSMVAWPVRTDGRFVRPAPEIPESSKGPRQSIYAGSFRRKNYREPWTPKKLATVELSIAKLTTLFALEPYRNEPPRQKSVFSFLDLAGQLDDTMRAGHARALEDIRLKQIRLNQCDAHDLGDYKHVRYPQYSPASGGPAADGRSWKLDGSLLAILGDYSRGLRGYQETLSRISYELMTSEYAPAVRTYTILINRFSRLGHHNIVDLIIRSFSESNIRPNELLIPSVILHYSRSGDKDGFEHFVEKTQGQHRGLQLAKPTLAVGIADKAGRVIRQGNKVIQKMQLDPVAYQAIISTYLHFDDVKAAAKWHQTMRKERIEPDLSLMVAFLKYDIKHFDWDRVQAIWGGIKKKWLTPEKVADLDHVDYAMARNAYHDMLYACKQKGDQHARWRDIYAEALSHGFALDETLLATDLPSPYTNDDELAEANQVRSYRKILERRFDILRKDFEQFEIIAAAARMILNDFPMGAISAMFQRRGDAKEEMYTEWKEGRPWLADYITEDYKEVNVRRVATPERENVVHRVIATRRDRIKSIRDAMDEQADKHYVLKRIRPTNVSSDDLIPVVEHTQHWEGSQQH
jgi:hypothetical protein